MRWLVLAALLASARPADARGCHERSYVVGYHHCTTFGLWSRDVDQPRLVIDIGFLHHRFMSEPFSLTSEPRETMPATDLRTGASLPGIHRILYAPNAFLYTGAELGFGWLTLTPHVGSDLSTSYGVFHALVGAHINPLWRVSLAAELAAGGRVDSMSSCTTKPCPDASGVTQTSRELEARALVDLWMTPQVSLGFGYGRSLIADNDSTWMIYVGFHVRPMDGMH
jgi:hypothetical protein